MTQIIVKRTKNPLPEKFPYSEFFWSAFSRNRTEYGEIWSISPYSVQMRENTDQENSEQKHFIHIGHGFCEHCDEFLKEVGEMRQYIRQTSSVQ